MDPHLVFSMPMFKDFVPEKLRPWIYVFIVCCFQMSGGLYLGSLNQLIGGRSFMREDILMCLYTNLAGMAIWFPMLFRMKFRFTNKTLLTASASVLIICNLLTPIVSFLPLLWFICFISGICKIQGTFECISNIQLWFAPQRNFKLFFPILMLIIMGNMHMSDIVTTYITYHYGWKYMHLLIVLLLIAVLLIQTTLVRHVRIAPKAKLYGIDTLGLILWALLLLQVSFILCFGDWYDWTNSPVILTLALTALVTLYACIHRMFRVHHPYLTPKLWESKNFRRILFITIIGEFLLATEHVLEEIFYEEVMHYGEMVTVRLEWVVLAGVVCAVLFALWWMYRMNYTYIRLLIVSFAFMAVYMIGFYFNIASDINIEKLYFPVFCRGFASTILSIVLLTTLQQSLSFEYFFQGLGVFNALHMIVGGVCGAAVYAKFFSYYVMDNIMRYGSAVTAVEYSASPFDFGHFFEGFLEQMMEISIKQIYGWVIYACIILFLCLLLYDFPIRREFRNLPPWKSVRPFGRRNSSSVDSIISSHSPAD